ncbi:unnamed protein product [Amoebophrya sp. A25]|nr:unnamed protein product [Amoebophrya sp. A25]|eukprot:GSA25T00013973001.1
MLRNSVRKRLIRVPDTKIEDFVFNQGDYKNVIVVGKHLCGPGTDAAIRFMERQTTDRIQGCVFATCCFNKITGQTFAKCFYPEYFSERAWTSSEVCEPVERTGTTGKVEQGHSDKSTSTTSTRVLDGPSSSDHPASFSPSFTSTIKANKVGQIRQQESSKHRKNYETSSLSSPEHLDSPTTTSSSSSSPRQPLPQSVEQTAEQAALNDTTQLHHAQHEDEAQESSAEMLAISSLAKMTSWRNTELTDNSLITPAMLREAEYFESWMQQYRKRKLATIFQSRRNVDELLYCHSGAHSQQNRCLVAWRGAVDEENGDHEILEDFDGLQDRRQHGDPRSIVQLGKALELEGEKRGSSFSTAPLEVVSNSTSSSSTFSSRTQQRLIAEFWACFRERVDRYKPLLPVDLRPVGLVSSKYGFDGRNLVRNKPPFQPTLESIPWNAKEEEDEAEKD